MVVTDNRIRAINYGARNDHRLGTQLAHGVHKGAGLIGRNLLDDRPIGK